MYPHRIRLHGPWDFEPVCRTVVHRDGRIDQRPGPVPAAGRMKIPATWSRTPLEGFRGKVLWRRHFHAPRTLEPHERLWIAFGGIDYFAEVSLNGTLLGRHEGYFEPFAVDLGSLVRQHNELIVAIDCPAELDLSNPRMIRGGLESRVPHFIGGLWRDVLLEVRSYAYLSDVTVHTTLHGTTGHVSVAGSARGTIETPVEIDLTVNGVAVDRKKVVASPQGSPFSMQAKVADVELWWPVGLGRAVLYAVRLEMHGAARTLDWVDRQVGFRDISYEPSGSEAVINSQACPAKIVEIDSPDDPLFTEPKSLPVGLSSWKEFGTLEMLRVPGRVTARGVYDWADCQGHLLVQDVPRRTSREPATLQHGRPADTEMEQEIWRQANAMEQLLRHHPCIAAWNDVDV